MKLSEIKGEHALDVLADIIDPLTIICSDEEFKLMISSKKPKLLMIKYLLKHYKKEILTILALLNEEEVEKFKPSIVQLPMMILELLNDQEVIDLFTYAEVDYASKLSTTAMENTMETGKE